MKDNINKIIDLYKSYHPVPKVDLIKRSYNLAKIVYFGEKRLSGQDWIEHALGVAYIVTKLKMDTSSICAAILHDTYKFGITQQEIEVETNAEIRQIVDNLESIKKIKGKYKGEYTSEGYSEYLRRLILSTSTDVRALVIRLAEKLHALKNINKVNEHLKKDAIEKAFIIYAPLADQIGIYDLKWRIEDLAFKHADKNIYEYYKKIRNSHPFASKGKIKQIIDSLEALIKNEVTFNRITGRKKRLYSLKNKILRYKSKLNDETKSIEKVKDIVAFRIIVNSVEDCYKALAKIHQQFKHLPEEFDDYIAKPKPNGYKSIQTTVELEPGHFAEIQIRTQEMHDYNEWGPASHYFYKMSGGNAVKVTGERKILMLKQLLSWKEKVIHDKTGVHIEALEDYIFVFTPKGDIIELPKEATPVDFAFKIHTTLGNKIGKVLVNQKQKPLNYILKNGDVVEIIKDKKRQGPNRDWLNFVKSKEARIYIKKYINKNR